MYKCCICGKEYVQSSDAVQCVNKCGREMFANRTFKKKDSTHRGETTCAEFSELVNIDTDKISEEIIHILAELSDKNSLQTAVLYTLIFSNWNDKTDDEKQADLNRLLMLKNLYSN